MSDFPDLYQQLLQGQNFQFCMLHPKLFRDYAAILAMPILDDQGILGDIWLFRQRDAGFIEPEIRLIQQVANQCAIAVRQARLYQLSQQQVQQLEQLHRLKDEFLSTVSHELRTPIANMKLAIHLLQRDIAPERREHYLSMLQLECNREADLINDLLDLQRLEAQAYPVVLESICLTEWLPGVLEPFRDRTQHQQQSLQLMCSPHLPLISTDGSILRRILAELLNNACKYTVAGGQIVLQASYLTSSAKVEVVVGNSAEIPAAELTLIFNKFYRVPQQDPWKLGGTGLGLALVQKLVAQLRGTLQVSSENGWTEFRVLLSIHSPANPLPSGADSPP
jgi:signal transduction histidine kinase